MKSDEIVIVTAFVDLRRERWLNGSRSQNHYFDYFRFWARIQNRLIVYLEEANKEYAEKIREIRAEFGLADKTDIVLVNDVFNLESNIYAGLKKNQSTELWKKYTLFPDAPEFCNAEYDYVVFMKSWFCKDAVKKFGLNKMNSNVVWMDFGYNHGGYYLQPEEFSFVWETSLLSDGRVHLFALEEIPDIPIFQVVRTKANYLAGGIMMAKANIWEDFHMLQTESIQELIDIGFIDDDQTVTLLSLKRQPELFAIHITKNWFAPIEETSGKQFTTYVPIAKKWKRPLIYIHNKILRFVRVMKYFVNNIRSV